MKKTDKFRIAAAVSAALLLGGAYVYYGDDIAQNRSEAEMRKHYPAPGVISALDEASLPDPTEAVNETESTSEDIIQTGTTSAEVALPEIREEVKDDFVNTAAELNRSYPDALGWLYVPDTNICYPVMQGGDNKYYLSHAYNGSELKAGSVFLDYRCENRFMNPINILYAHNMQNGSMFAAVLSFADDSFFESHRYGWLATPEKLYRIDFFSCAKADWLDELYNGSTPIAEWLPHIRDKSVMLRDMDFSENDRFISLSTCSYEFENARTILTGKLVETED